MFIAHSTKILLITKAKIKKKQTANARADVGGEELSFIDSGIANWSVTQKISKNSQNPKISVPSGPDIPLFGVSPRDSIPYSTHNCSATITAFLFTQLANRNSMNVLQLINKQ